MRSDICAVRDGIQYSLVTLAALASAAALLCVSPATAPVWKSGKLSWCSCARQVTLLEGRTYNWDIPELRRLLKRELSCA